jgi:transposase
MEAVMADVMDEQATGIQPAVLVATELSRASWLLAVYDPTTDKISRRRIAGGDDACLIGVIGEAQRRAEHRAGGPVGAECVFEAGYDGF